jgi:pyruvate,water dikinase
MLNEVSFELPEPAYADFTWVISDEHTPVAAPPLTADQFAARSNDDGVPRSLRINGFTYMRQDATPPGIPQFPPGPLPSSRDQMRSWRTEWQPEVDKLIERLRGFDPESVPSGSWAATLEEQSREYWRVFGAVHRAAVLPAHAVGQRFQELYLKRFGQARHSDGLALLQGIPNASLERAGLLWQASRVLHADPALLEILDRGEALPESASARQLQAAFDGLLQRFGCTSEGFVEDQPNWSEDPSVPLAAILAYARLEDGRGPLDAADRQRIRRERLEAELRGLAPMDAASADLVTIMEVAQELLPNLEDHNYYTDQCLSAASRKRWLAIGRHLKRRDVVGADDDVFYFYPPELLLSLEGEAVLHRDVLNQRRQDLAAWRSVVPPPVLGRPPAELNQGSMGLRTSEMRMIHGVAASPGSYRGQARVIDSLAQASGLRRGDVLVCRATTPAWTPFFGVVSAIVTNTGGMLSHSAIVAREFAIPAVIGTVNGSARIIDGATVTVDGTNGVVVVED